MGSRDEISEILGLPLHSSNDFISAVTRHFPESISPSQIASALRKLPEGKRRATDVVLALGGELLPGEITELNVAAFKATLAALPASHGLQRHPRRKDHWKDYQAVIKENGVECLYHFTDAANLPSIQARGGLYSWEYCQEHDIGIPHPGSSELSRRLDARKGLEDYVRLGFNAGLPMFHVAAGTERVPSPVILCIDTDVIYWRETRFSVMNATDNRISADRIDESLETLKRINFMRAVGGRWNGPITKIMVQAEVLVKTHVPLDMITDCRPFSY